MRLDKFLCESQGITRSVAGNMVKKGRVNINGQRAKSASIKVQPDDDIISLDGEPVMADAGFQYFMMHKPAGYVCANQDSEHPIVFDLLKNEKKLKNLHTVGRLDKDTTGLLFITDDGNWSHVMTSPKHDHPKTYRTFLAEPLIEDAEQQCHQGFMLNNETHPTKPAVLERISDHEVLLTISEGRYHQVKRMFAAMGNRVEKLHRENIAGIPLDPKLAPGEYRTLTPSERLALGITP